MEYLKIDKCEKIGTEVYIFNCLSYRSRTRDLTKLTAANLEFKMAAIKKIKSAICQLVWEIDTWFKGLW